MNIWQAIENRHSVRTFDQTREVSSEDVRKIVEAAILAPSGGNCQPWHFVVVRDPSVRAALANAAHGQESLSHASAVIAVCSEPQRSAAYYGRRGQDMYALLDAGAASEHILLAATALGLGSCWISAFEDAAVRRVLRLPDHLSPTALIAIGYSDGASAKRSPRRPYEELVSEI